MVTIANHRGTNLATSDLTDILVNTPQRVFTLVDFITQNPVKRAAIERVLTGDDMSMEKKLDMFIATGYGLFELAWTEGEGEKAGQGLWIKVNDPVTGEAKYKCTIDGAITNYLTVAEAGKGSDKASMEYHVKNRLAIRVPELALQLWRDSGLVNEGSEFETFLTTLLTYADSEQLSKGVMRYGLIALAMPERFLSDQAFEELKRRVLPEGFINCLAKHGQIWTMVWNRQWLRRCNHLVRTTSTRNSTGSGAI